MYTRAHIQKLVMYINFFFHPSQCTCNRFLFRGADVHEIDYQGVFLPGSLEN